MKICLIWRVSLGAAVCKRSYESKSCERDDVGNLEGGRLRQIYVGRPANVDRELMAVPFMIAFMITSIATGSVNFSIGQGG
jgi:hypothetical protein